MAKTAPESNQEEEQEAANEGKVTEAQKEANEAMEKEAEERGDMLQRWVGGGK